MKADYVPYEGEQPYIFISYSHSDLEQVKPLLSALCAVGYRVWYDRGIYAGKNWTDELANHIARCEVFMPLHTQASVQSDFCRNEIHFAREEGRKIVPVYLEENVKLSGGLRLLLHSIQHRRISDYGGISGFVKHLSQEPYFVPCRDKSMSKHELPSPEISKTLKEKNSLPSSYTSQTFLSKFQTLDWHRDGGIIWAYCDGTLYIGREPGGNGQMPDYEWSESDSHSTSPWKIFREQIRRIEIEEGVTKIGKLAFYRYERLSYVSIPNSVTRIGEWAFEGCKWLTHVTLPHGVTRIDWRAFNGCTALTSVNIPDSVTEIGAEAFNDCKELTSVVIPDSVTRISWGLFSGCTSLTSVKFHNKITEIGEEAFYGCVELADAIIPRSVTEIGHSAFLGCRELTNVTIPDNTIRIGKWAFLGCKKLRSVEIPARTRIFRLLRTSFPWRTKIIRRLTG